MAKELRTWAGRSSFAYEGDPLTDGTRIYFATDRRYLVNVTKEQYAALLSYFKGQTVSAGTSRDKAPAKSVGRWLQDNVTKTAIASYVCPVLVHYGFAKKQADKIIFK